MSETILITGFEPFGGIAGNPTMDMVAALHGARIDNRQVVGRILPVTYDGHLLRLKMLMDEVEPALVIGFGLDVNALGIQVETQAVNRADFNIPDNAGALLKNVTLEAGGPAYRMSTFPVEEIVAALSAVRIKAAPSGDAGRYLCNATLFHLLDLCAAKPQRPLCGFVHVPYATEQLATEESVTDESVPEELVRGELVRGELAPGQLLGMPASAARERAMPLEMMIEAARIVLRQSSLVTRQMALPTLPQPARPLHQRNWMEPAAAVG